MSKLPVTISLLACFAFAACGQGNMREDQSSAQHQQGGKIPAAAYGQKLAATAQAQLVDVRTPSEFREGHIKGAVNIDVHGEGFSTEVAKLDKTLPVFVYCMSGRRSSDAADQLADMGFGEVYNLEGGIQSWTEAGQPVER